MFTRMVRKQDNKKQKRISSSTIAVIGSVILLTGGFFLSYNYMQSKKVKAFDYMANVFYQSEEVEILEHDGELQQEQKEEELGEVTNDYIGYLTIPNLNLTKGFLDMRSEYNNIEQNITVIKGSSYPDKEKGNMIIAAHSGTGWKAFFNDL